MEDELWTYDKCMSYMTTLLRNAVKAQGKISSKEIVDMLNIIRRENPELDAWFWTKGIEVENGNEDFSGMTTEARVEDFNINYDLGAERVKMFTHIGMRVFCDECLANLPDLDEKEIDGKMCLVPT